MKYIGYPCEVCKKNFTQEDDVVVCPVCGTPHHRECWQINNSCAREALHANGFVWKTPEESTPQNKPEEPAKRVFQRNDTEYDDMPEIMCKNGEKAVQCPHCGSLNYEKDIYCMRCHKPLKPEAGAEQPQTEPAPNEPFREDDNTDSAFENKQINDFNRFGGIDPDSTVDGIPIREYSDYVGGKTPGKIIRRVKLMERFGRQFSPTIPALLLGPIWYFYRKLTKMGTLLLVIWALLGIGGTVLSFTQPMKDYYQTAIGLAVQMTQGAFDMQEFQTALNDAANIYEYAERTDSEATREIIAVFLQYLQTLGVSIASSLLAMSAYRKKAKKDILDARRENNNMEGYRLSLLKKGGTSLPLAILAGAVMAAVYLLSVYFPILLTFFSK